MNHQKSTIVFSGQGKVEEEEQLIISLKLCMKIIGHNTISAAILRKKGRMLSMDFKEET